MNKEKFYRVEVCKKCDSIYQKEVKNFEDCDYISASMCNDINCMLAIKWGNVGFHELCNCPECCDSPTFNEQEVNLK